MTRLNKDDRCRGGLLMLLGDVDAVPPTASWRSGEFRPVNRGNENARSLCAPLLAPLLLPNMFVVAVKCMCK